MAYPFVSYPISIMTVFLISSVHIISSFHCNITQFGSCSKTCQASKRDMLGKICQVQKIKLMSKNKAGLDILRIDVNLQNVKTNYHSHNRRLLSNGCMA